MMNEVKNDESAANEESLKPVVMRGKWIDCMATNIARELFECGDQYMSPTVRIEFRARGKTSHREDERPLGGLCESALVEFLAEAIEKQFTA